MTRIGHGFLTVAAAALLAMTAGSASAEGDKPKVVTSFTVLADMARNVAGDHAEIVSITKPGAEIHGYEPTPQDIAQTLDADLILWNGLNLELWFEQFLSNMPEVPAVVVSDGLEPVMIAEGSYEGKPNPHAWMGVDGARVYVDNMVAALSSIDPDHAGDFRANGDAYLKKIDETLATARAEIEAIPQDRRWLVSCEGAFSYMARDLGMHELYLWPINADETGTPQQVRKVIDGVREHQIPAVFCESTVSQKPAEQVARETGAAYGGVLYVDSLSAEDGPVPSYIDLLRVTTETIAKGLNGKS